MRHGKWLLAIMCTLIGSPAVLAEEWTFLLGNMDSGGGHAVVCENSAGEITRVELFDFYEARNLDSLELHFPSGSTQEKVRGLIARIPIADKDRRGEYEGLSSLFFGGASDAKIVAFVRGNDLPFFDDSASGILPPRGCHLKQLAIQREPQFDNDPRFIINGDLWDHLSDDDQAGLVLHEMIYWDARQLGATDSRRSRHFNALLAADRWKPLDGESDALPYHYFDTLKQLHLPTVYTQLMVNANGGSIPVYLDLTTMYFSDVDAKILWGGKIYAPRYTGFPTFVSLATCRPTFSNTLELEAPMDLDPHGANELRFHENGCLSDVTFSRTTPELPLARFYSQHRAPVSAMSFGVDGTPTCAVLGGESSLVDSSGRLRNYTVGTVVFLDSESRVVSTDDPIACGIYVE